MGLISVAKPMIGDVFTASMPHLVTASFASSYLMAMAAGNLAGRIGWAGKFPIDSCSTTVVEHWAKLTK